MRLRHFIHSRLKRGTTQKNAPRETQGRERASPAIEAREVRVPLEDAAILAVAAKVSLQADASLNGEDEAVLAALRRAHPNAGDTNEELGRWLAEMNQTQLQGVVSNTKGVLHEMRFVEMENADGDTIYAAQFASTNHAGYDVVFSDDASGSGWVAQLKATDSQAYVREWLEQHPNGDILVTSEIAERMGLESSGISNADLTVDTNRLVDRLISADQNDSIWVYVPGLAALSVAAIIYELHERLKRGEISRDQFAWMAAKATGKSAARIVLLTGLLSIPVINVAAGLALVANFLSSSGILERLETYVDKELSVMDATEAYEMAVSIEKISIEGALASAEESHQLDIQLKNESEEYRALLREAHSEYSSLYQEEFKKNGPVYDYSDPAKLTPPEHPRGEVEDLIRAKVNEIEIERRQLFRQARSALKDNGLRPHFLASLQEYLGEVGSKRLLALVSKD